MRRAPPRQCSRRRSAQVFGAIRIAPDGEEGIQPDMIYRTRRAVTGSDGLAFVDHCARFITLAHGTPWQAPVEAVKLFAAFLLDGQQWLMRHGVGDPNFPQRTARPARGGPAGNWRDTNDRLAQLGDTPSPPELAALARRLAGRGGALTGHRHFWRSGFSVHQRPGLLRFGASAVEHLRHALGTTVVLQCRQGVRGA